MFTHMFPRRGDLSIFDRGAPAGFFFEPKFEGTRIFLYKEKENIVLVNQKNINILFKFPEMLDSPCYINAESCVLDGILVVLKNGKVDATLLQERELLEKPTKIKVKSKKIPATLFVFDILEINGVSLLFETLKKRREILEKIIKSSELIKICPGTFNGKSLWAEVKEKNYEGVIAKSFYSKYTQGRSWDWLRLQNFETMNAVVLGIKEDSYLLGAYKKQNLSFVGKLKKEKFLDKYLSAKIKKIKINERILDFPEEPEVMLRPEIVIKVKYEKITSSLLENPEFIRIRLDKSAEDCVIEDEI